MELEVRLDFGCLLVLSDMCDVTGTHPQWQPPLTAIFFPSGWDTMLAVRRLGLKNVGVSDES